MSKQTWRKRREQLDFFIMAYLEWLDHLGYEAYHGDLLEKTQYRGAWLLLWLALALLLVALSTVSVGIFMLMLKVLGAGVAEWFMLAYAAFVLNRVYVVAGYYRDRFRF